jgi:hypothetical protein
MACISKSTVKILMSHFTGAKLPNTLSILIIMVCTCQYLDLNPRQDMFYVILSQSSLVGIRHCMPHHSIVRLIQNPNQISNDIRNTTQVTITLIKLIKPL